MQYPHLCPQLSGRRGGDGGGGGQLENEITVIKAPRRFQDRTSSQKVETRQQHAHSGSDAKKKKKNEKRLKKKEAPMFQRTTQPNDPLTNLQRHRQEPH